MPAPGALLTVTLTRLFDLLQLIERIVMLRLLFFHRRTVNTSFCTIEGIYHKRQFFPGEHSFFIILQEFICMALSFYLPDKNLFPAEPVNIFLKASRHRVNRAKSVFNLIGNRCTGNIMFSDIPHQMIERNIIRYVTAAVRIVNFRFLGNTGTDKSKFIRYLHIFFGINGAAHHR